jgi:hypothetical protein
LNLGGELYMNPLQHLAVPKVPQARPTPKGTSRMAKPSRFTIEQFQAGLTWTDMPADVQHLLSILILIVGSPLEYPRANHLLYALGEALHTAEALQPPHGEEDAA